MSIEMLDRLIHIIKQTGCFIVVSSSWSTEAVIESVNDLTSDPEMITKIILGHTPNIRLPSSFIDHDADDFDSKFEKHWSQEREQEILSWVENHPEISNWVAVDDINLPLPSNNFVRTNHEIGLTESDMDEIIFKLMA